MPEPRSTPVSRTSDGRVYWATEGRQFPGEERGAWLSMTPEAQAERRTVASRAIGASMILRTSTHEIADAVLAALGLGAST